MHYAKSLEALNQNLNELSEINEKKMIMNTFRSKRNSKVANISITLPKNESVASPIKTINYNTPRELLNQQEKFLYKTQEDFKA